MGTEPPHRGDKPGSGPEGASLLVRDPVCGMQVDPRRNPPSQEHAGKTYYFCCPHCREKFQVEPQKYLAGAPRPMGGLLGIAPAGGAGTAPAAASAPIPIAPGDSAAPAAGTHPASHVHATLAACAPAESAPAPAHPRVGPTAEEFTCPMDPEVRQRGPGACPKCGMALEPVIPRALAAKSEYVCPMHPEIVRAEPGDCPICGMALEPRTASAEEEKNPELEDMTRRFWAAVALAAPVLLVAMGGEMPGSPLRGWASPRF